MATPIPIFPTDAFDLTSSESIKRSLRISQTGSFSVDVTGGDGVLARQQARIAPAAPIAATIGGPLTALAVAAPVRIGGGSGGDGGGDVGGTVPLLSVDWTLIDPDGKEFFSSEAGPAALITADTLRQFRDLEGFSSRAWSLRISLPDNYRGATKITCAGSIAPLTEGSISAAPLVGPIDLTVSGPHPFDFLVDRVGDISVLASGDKGEEIDLQLLQPNGSVVATGKNKLTYPVGLVDLHKTVNKPWRLTAAAASGKATKCSVRADVLGTVRIPRTVLQPRLDAILGDPSIGGSVTIGVDADPSAGDDVIRNVVSLTINKDLFFTLDNFGFLDLIEAMRLQWERSFNPAAVHVDLDPDAPYPFMSFDGGNRIHNLRTGAITIVAGHPDFPSGGEPLLTMTIPLLNRPGGTPTEIDGSGATVELEGGTIAIEITILATEPLGVTASVNVPTPIIHFNIEHLPDWLKDVPGAIGAQVQAKVTNDAVTTVLRTVFKTLMGGLFTFRSSAWNNNAFEFTFIAGVEEPPHVVSPFYSARGTVAPGTVPSFVSPNLEKIDHIVVLMMENRSFDHVLGYLSLTGGRSDVDGLTPAIVQSFPPGMAPAPYTDTLLPFDPDHSFQPVGVQMANGGVGTIPMRGFALSLLQKYPFLAFAPDNQVRKDEDDPFWYERRKPYTTAAANGYHTDHTLPFYAFLAREYMISDRWYASHPGPTFPNRFFYLSGHLGTNADGEPQRDSDTSSLRLLRGRAIQDALTERGVAWKMYESGPDVCMLRAFARYAFDDTNIRPIEEFYTDARGGKLPPVTFLEPQYHIGEHTNDDHPPCDMAAGQAFVRGVYEALTANVAAWNKTLFIITYDEHGGLHDHRVPDLADRYVQPGKPPLDVGYGVRVPAFIISPWVPGGATTRRTTQAVFDHTSIMKTIVNRFCPDDPAIMSDRMAFANDLFPLLTLSTPRPPSAFSAVSSGVGTISGIFTKTPTSPPKSTAIVNTFGTTLLGGGGTVAVTTTAPRPVRSPIIAEALAQHAPLLRGRELFHANTDWHQYMSRLALLLR